MLEASGPVPVYSWEGDSQQGKGLPGAWEPEWNPGPPPSLAAAPRCFPGAWVSVRRRLEEAQGRVRAQWKHRRE